MKAKFKALIVAAVAAVSALNANALGLDILNHLSVGANVGTTGLGIDVAMPVTPFITIRPGYHWMPKISPKFDFDVDVPSQVSSLPVGNIPSEVELKGDLKFSGAKFLIDIYPFITSGFHVTAGAFFGGDEIVNLYNTQPGVLKAAADFNATASSMNVGHKVGVELGDYLLTPDAKGNINANLKVKKFRPYAGIGFGRAVPGLPIGFMFELGAQFWGNPSVYCNGEELKKDKVGDGDAGKIIKTISKVSVYPVLNFRICGKIF